MRPTPTPSLSGLVRLVSEFLERELNDVHARRNDAGGALVQLLAYGNAARIGRVLLASCEAFDNLPSDRQGAGAGRQAPARPVRRLHAADATEAGAAASARLRMADEARRRRRQLYGARSWGSPRSAATRCACRQTGTSCSR